MSESELFAAYHGSGAIWLGLVSIFISILFAYLITAYLVGRKLSSVQMAIISGLFTAFSLFLIIVMHTVSNRMGQFSSESKEINPERIVPATAGYTTLVSTIFVLAFLAGIVFMIQVRRRSKRPDS